MTTTRSTPGDADVVEVEFAVTEPAYPFVSIARREECRIALEQLLPREGDRQAEYFRVVDADPDRVVELASQASDAIAKARSLAETADRGLVEFVVEDGCPVRALAERGAIPTIVEGTPSRGTIVAEIVPEDDPGAIVDAMLQTHDVELVAKRTRSDPTPLVEGQEFRPAVFERLTDRQREVLRAAYDAGYYERPRHNTGEEIAAELGISPTTFQEHVRAAERKLVTFLIEEN